MNQDELRRQMDLLAEDARQRSVGRRIAGALPAKFSSKTPISLLLPDDDWEEELAAPIPSTSKSKGTSTLSKGKSPTSTQKKTCFSFHLPKAPKEVQKLKRQPGWSEWGEKVQRKLHGKDY